MKTVVGRSAAEIKEAIMNGTKRTMVVVFMFAVCMGMASAQQTTIKKRKVTVLVEEDKHCPQGISVSGRFVGGRRLCADYPEGVSDRFQQLVGSIVEVEAFWTFEGDLKRETPVALGQVFRIGGEKVEDTSKLAGNRTPPLSPTAKAGD